MREVKFKNKKANHNLNVQGKMVTFTNGKAVVEDITAENIARMANPDYTVVEEKEQPKPRKQTKQSKKSRKKK